MNDQSPISPLSPMPTGAAASASPLAAECADADFHALDRGFRDLVKLYLAPDAHAHFEPHFARLGKLAGGRLDELARIADQHPPVLEARDRSHPSTPPRWLMA